VSPEQRRLARHALGLDNSTTVYRNRYIAARLSPDVSVWSQLCDEGLAVQARNDEATLTYALTLRGAIVAMERHETLPRDFALHMIELEDRAKAQPR
jgi:hypothetical protein